jgi:hypothetical protein
VVDFSSKTKNRTKGAAAKSKGAADDDDVLYEKAPDAAVFDEPAAKQPVTEPVTHLAPANDKKKHADSSPASKEGKKAKKGKKEGGGGGCIVL